MAAKRHHSSMKMKKHHSSPVRRHGHLGAEHYAGADPRRRQEHEDSMMLSEDHNAVANLPQHVIQHDWARPYNRYAKFELDDTMKGIDEQENEDGSGMQRHLQPGKY